MLVGIVTDVGSRIRMARRVAGLLQEQLAEKAGIDQATVSRWEHRDEVPDRAGSLLAIARALGVSVDWLLTGEGQGPAIDVASTGTDD